MPLIDISQAKSWMKRTGSWFSDVWAYLSNIQYLMEQQAQVQTLLSSIPATITRIRFYTVSMPIANRQYSFVLPDHTKSIEMDTTSGAAFRISFDPGRVGPIARRPYRSVPVNTSWDRDKLDLTGNTLHFACGTAGVTMELAIGT
ncbi:unnamed protein product [marine sediment metagenome]|uniref:Uncharacterized protein n=1 Tax=marine sediment metagenome TaxID=412755 RepID=X0SP87_9ZZZZ